jgi:PPOX class probable F420-dependent enzyme
VSRRDQIRMSDEELREFLEQSQTIIICSIGKDGVPHPMPMWFGLEEDGAVVMTTFTKSQKIKNLRRDPRVSLLAEAGEIYSELRGVALYGVAELDTDPEKVLDVLQNVSARSSGVPATDAGAIREGMRASALKRCLIRVKPDKIVSWDHRKLSGVY